MVGKGEDFLVKEDVEPLTSVDEHTPRTYGLVTASISALILLGMAIARYPEYQRQKSEREDYYAKKDEMHESFWQNRVREIREEPNQWRDVVEEVPEFKPREEATPALRAVPVDSSQVKPEIPVARPVAVPISQTPTASENIPARPVAKPVIQEAPDAAEKERRSELLNKLKIKPLEGTFPEAGSSR